MVYGVDERVWSVSTQIKWTDANPGDEFEHDVSSTSGSIVVVASLFFFWIFLFLWKPSSVIFPWFYWLAVLALGLFLAFRWLRSRTVILIVETPGLDDLPAERWEGQVRIGRALWDERRILTRRIQVIGTPGHADSPLMPRDVSAPQHDEHAEVINLRKDG